MFKSHYSKTNYAQRFLKKVSFFMETSCSESQRTTLFVSGLVLSLLFTSLSRAQDADTVVAVATVEQRALRPTVLISGAIQSRQTANVTAGATGKLLWVVEPGVAVGAGDVIARVEDTTLRLEHAETKLEIEREQIKLVQLNRDAQRLQQLKERNVTAETDLDQMRLKRDLATNSLGLKKVHLEKIEDQLRRVKVKAPFPGVITRRDRQAGEDVVKDSILVEIMDVEQLEVIIDAPLKLRHSLTVGDTLTVYNVQGEFSSSIRALIPSIDPRSQTFEVRGIIPAVISGQLTSGELVTVALPKSAEQQALVVPRDALVLRKSGSYVMRVNQQNKAEKIRVNVGDGDGEWIAVTGTLQANDKVVIRGAEMLLDGQRVTIKEANSGDLDA